MDPRHELERDDRSVESFTRPTRWEVARQHLALGYTHILPKGRDHILFVLGLFLLTPRIKPMLLQVTAFTIAHSITLALSIYGVVSLPSRIVEPLIVFSIAYVAIENLATRELGLPRDEFVTGLLTFNLGVEGGQLTVILLASIVVAPFVKRGWYRQRVVIPASLVMAAIAIYRTIVRISA